MHQNDIQTLTKLYRNEVEGIAAALNARKAPETAQTWKHPNGEPDAFSHYDLGKAIAFAQAISVVVNGSPDSWARALDAVSRDIRAERVAQRV